MIKVCMRRLEQESVPKLKGAQETASTVNEKVRIFGKSSLYVSTKTGLDVAMWGSTIYTPKGEKQQGSL